MARQTNAARSAATQDALIQAATDLLMERGWAATTSVAVCERAGLTRGALMHHYTSLSALLADALGTLYADFTESFGQPADSMEPLIGQMWGVIGDPRFKAVIEAWSAAANDQDLAKELSPTIEQFSKLVAPDSGRRSGAIRSPEARAFVLTAREAMLGLALGRACNGGQPVKHERTVISRLKNEAVAADARRSEEGEAR